MQSNCALRRKKKEAAGKRGKRAALKVTNSTLDLEAVAKEVVAAHCASARRCKSVFSYRSSTSATPTSCSSVRLQAGARPQRAAALRTEPDTANVYARSKTIEALITFLTHGSKWSASKHAEEARGRRSCTRSFCASRPMRRRLLLPLWYMNMGFLGIFFGGPLAKRFATAVVYADVDSDRGRARPRGAEPQSTAKQRAETVPEVDTEDVEALLAASSHDGAAALRCVASIVDEGLAIVRTCAARPLCSCAHTFARGSQCMWSCASTRVPHRALQTLR